MAPVDAIPSSNIGGQGSVMLGLLQLKWGTIPRKCQAEREQDIPGTFLCSAQEGKRDV